MSDRKRVLCVSFIEPARMNLEELGKDYGEDAIYVTITDDLYPARAMAFSNRSFKYHPYLPNPGEVVESVAAKSLFTRDDIPQFLKETRELNDGVVTYELAFRQGVRAIRELHRIKDNIDNSVEGVLKIR